MAISYKPNNTTYGVRSISLPTTSHPSTHTIEKELNQIKTWVLSSTSCKQSIESICDGLLTLSRLYECLHDSTNLLSSIHNVKWVEELLERLVKFLDVCSIMKDILSQFKEHVRDLHCALRRRKGDSSLENSICSYNCFRKKVKKDVKRLMSSLNQSMVTKSGDHHEVVFKMVMEATISVFESILMNFVIGDSQARKENKWCMVVSKLSQRTRVGSEEQHYQNKNDYESLDVKLDNRCTKDGVSSWSYDDICRLETMEAEIERIENSLEYVFRRWIRTRACLLNTISNY